VATRDWLCGTVRCPAFLAIECFRLRRPDASRLDSCGRRWGRGHQCNRAPPFDARPADGRAGIQHRIEHAVGQRRRKVNLDPPHGAARDAQRSGDLPVGDAIFVFEPQDPAYSSHRHSPGWHRFPTRRSCDEQSTAYRPAVERVPTLQGWPSSSVIRTSDGPQVSTVPVSQRHGERTSDGFDAPDLLDAPGSPPCSFRQKGSGASREC